MSPAPSDLPARKDDAEEDLHMSHSGVSVASIEETLSEGSSDEENEQDSNPDDPYSGYVALEQDFQDEEQQTAVDEIEYTATSAAVSNDSGGSQSGSHSICTSDDTSIAQETMAVQDFKMSESQTEAVKQAMAGFNLPMHNIPDWAKTVPEDNWKSKLMETIAKTRNDP